MTLHVSTRDATDELLAQPNLRLRVGEHVVDVGALRVVTRPDLPRLTSKSAAVLIELVRHAGKTVTRDRLLDSVWTGRFTTPDVLTQAIKELRRAFGDDSKPSQYIETIPKVGYRLIAPVLALDGPEGGIFVESADGGLVDEHIASSPAAMDAGEAEAVAVTRAHPSRSKAAWIAGAGVLAAIGIAAVLLVALRERAPATADSLLHAEDLRALTSYPGPERRPNLSPDGTRVAFGIIDKDSGFDRVVVRSIEPSQLVHLSIGRNEHEAQPIWSPDGTRIAFERLRGRGCTMYVAASLGGDEREVGTCADYNVNYYDWTPDGKSIVTADVRGGGAGLALATLDLDSGRKTFLDYARANDDQDLEPHYSPDGRWIAVRRGIAPYSDLFVVPAGGGKVRQVTHVAARIRGHTWTSDSRAIVFASNFAGPMSLYAADVDSGRTRALGVSPAEYPNAARDADRVVYEIPRAQNTLALVDLESGGVKGSIAPSTGSDYAATLSPSADRIAFVSDRGGEYQLWVYGRVDEALVPLSSPEDGAVFSPRWRSDGRRVLAVRYDEATHRRSLVEIDVATRRQRVVSGAGDNVLFGDYGVDDDSVLVAIGSSGKDNSLVLVAHPGKAAERRTVIESAVAYARVDRERRAVYYTTIAGRGLYRFDVDGGRRDFVSAEINAISMNGWRIVDGRIWYLVGFGVSPVTVHELDPETKADRVVGQLKVALRDVDFNVLPDRKTVLVSQLGTEDTDVGLFRLAGSDIR